MKKSPVDLRGSKRREARQQRTESSRSVLGHWTWASAATAMRRLTLAARGHGYLATMGVPGERLDLVLVPLHLDYTTEARPVIDALAGPLRGRCVDAAAPTVNAVGAWCERILLPSGSVIAVQLRRQAL